MRRTGLSGSLDPVALGDAEIGAELARLADQLRTARQAAGLSSRAAAESAGMNQGTLWRIEMGRTRPTFIRFARLVWALGLELELDDGRNPPRRPPGEGWRLPPGYQLGPIVLEASQSQTERTERAGLHRVRCRLGSELWWARHLDLVRPLSAQGACRLLGISHHTLAAVEFGPDWPDMASIVLVAGLTGRRLDLVRASDGFRAPPWQRG